ncbi:hypothetical protein [Streptomyces sp. NBC_00162]|uniref:hypothetical protein n=1 Tax=Streptomyces sp. NBC_00162 TaxID=2903629 RepID=UPI00214BEEAF|nr:hypothetical protein [Streptomyces sp. NBC_00162]UUU37660.1 hypothetical protein JIW86_01250 [Streptomyces sp. NBC_00162]
MTASQSRDLLNEGLPSAQGVRADEPADLQAQNHTPFRAGQISRKPHETWRASSSTSIKALVPAVSP